MKVAIYSRGLDAEQGSSLQALLEELAMHKIRVFIYHLLLEQFSLPQHLIEQLTPFQLTEDLDEDVECLIGIGGDGTILDAVTIVKDSNIPILGINFGRLGFLASMESGRWHDTFRCRCKKNISNRWWWRYGY